MHNANTSNRIPNRNGLPRLGSAPAATPAFEEALELDVVEESMIAHLEKNAK
jgi:hypothetical protein